MEKIIVVIILAILALLFLGKQTVVMVGVLGAVAIASAGMTLFFIFFVIRLLFSKKRKAKFLRIERNTIFKWRAAFYEIGGEEYPCVFPDDGIMDDKIYKTDKEYTVFLNRRMGKVYDRIAVTTCVIGLVFTLAIDFGMIFLYLLFYR